MGRKTAQKHSKEPSRPAQQPQRAALTPAAAARTTTGSATTAPPRPPDAVMFAVEEPSTWWAAMYRQPDPVGFFKRALRERYPAPPTPDLMATYGKVQQDALQYLDGVFTDMHDNHRELTDGAIMRIIMELLRLDGLDKELKKKTANVVPRPAAAAVSTTPGHTSNPPKPAPPPAKAPAATLPTSPAAAASAAPAAAKVAPAQAPPSLAVGFELENPQSWCRAIEADINAAPRIMKAIRARFPPPTTASLSVQHTEAYRAGMEEMKSILTEVRADRGYASIGQLSKMAVLMLSLQQLKNVEEKEKQRTVNAAVPSRASAPAPSSAPPALQQPKAAAAPTPTPPKPSPTPAKAPAASLPPPPAAAASAAPAAATAVPAQAPPPLAVGFDVEDPESWYRAIAADESAVPRIMQAVLERFPPSTVPAVALEYEEERRIRFNDLFRILSSIDAAEGIPTPSQTAFLPEVLEYLRHLEKEMKQKEAHAMKPGAATTTISSSPPGTSGPPIPPEIDLLFEEIEMWCRAVAADRNSTRCIMRLLRLYYQPPTMSAVAAEDAFQLQEAFDGILYLLEGIPEDGGGVSSERIFSLFVLVGKLRDMDEEMREKGGRATTPGASTASSEEPAFANVDRLMDELLSWCKATELDKKAILTIMQRIRDRYPPPTAPAIAARHTDTYRASLEEIKRIFEVLQAARWLPFPGQLDHLAVLMQSLQRLSRMDEEERQRTVNTAVPSTPAAPPAPQQPKTAAAVATTAAPALTATPPKPAPTPAKAPAATLPTSPAAAATAVPAQAPPTPASEGIMEKLQFMCRNLATDRSTIAVALQENRQRCPPPTTPAIAAIYGESHRACVDLYASLLEDIHAARGVATANQLTQMIVVVKELATITQLDEEERRKTTDTTNTIVKVPSSVGDEIGDPQSWCRAVAADKNAIPRIAKAIRDRFPPPTAPAAVAQFAELHSVTLKELPELLEDVQAAKGIATPMQLVLLALGLAELKRIEKEDEEEKQRATNAGVSTTPSAQAAPVAPVATVLPTPQRPKTAAAAVSTTPAHVPTPPKPVPTPAKAPAATLPTSPASAASAALAAAKAPPPLAAGFDVEDPESWYRAIEADESAVPRITKAVLERFPPSTVPAVALEYAEERRIRFNDLFRILSSIKATRGIPTPSQRLYLPNYLECLRSIDEEMKQKEARAMKPGAATTTPSLSAPAASTPPASTESDFLLEETEMWCRAVEADKKDIRYIIQLLRQRYPPPTTPAVAAEYAQLQRETFDDISYVLAVLNEEGERVPHQLHYTLIVLVVKLRDMDEEIREKEGRATTPGVSTTSSKALAPANVETSIDELMSWCNYTTLDKKAIPMIMQRIRDRYPPPTAPAIAAQHAESYREGFRDSERIFTEVQAAKGLPSGEQLNHLAVLMQVLRRLSRMDEEERQRTVNTAVPSTPAAPPAPQQPKAAAAPAPSPPKLSPTPTKAPAASLPTSPAAAASAAPAAAKVAPAQAPPSPAVGFELENPQSWCRAIEADINAAPRIMKAIRARFPPPTAPAVVAQFAEPYRANVSEISSRLEDVGAEKERSIAEHLPYLEMLLQWLRGIRKMDKREKRNAVSTDVSGTPPAPAASAAAAAPPAAVPPTPQQRTVTAAPAASSQAPLLSTATAVSSAAKAAAAPQPPASTRGPATSAPPAAVVFSADDLSTWAPSLSGSADPLNALEEALRRCFPAPATPALRERFAEQQENVLGTIRDVLAPVQRANNFAIPAGSAVAAEVRSLVSDLHFIDTALRAAEREEEEREAARAAKVARTTAKKKKAVSSSASQQQQETKAEEEAATATATPAAPATNTMAAPAETAPTTEQQASALKPLSGQEMSVPAPAAAILPVSRAASAAPAMSPPAAPKRPATGSEDAETPLEICEDIATEWDGSWATTENDDDSSEEAAVDAAPLVESTDPAVFGQDDVTTLQLMMAAGPAALFPPVPTEDRPGTSRRAAAAIGPQSDSSTVSSPSALLFTDAARAAFAPPTSALRPFEPTGAAVGGQARARRQPPRQKRKPRIRVLRYAAPRT